MSAQAPCFLGFFFGGLWLDLSSHHNTPGVLNHRALRVPGQNSNIADRISLLAQVPDLLNILLTQPLGSLILNVFGVPLDSL